ncbi:proline-rich receptor-like protein kinase PERK8 [Impatiens glandulifera]|uniref:proline-rich receptor-like protein kinase PERK8 n=1 Tax=Impatiens glandulifera TaxID=253017 RepID=UPI001FB1503C|nr:proline-rich receptor-like protein kinase PERK8 [Impatiens glandulifera]
MASRTNKYASLNFNDIYEKKIITTSNNRSHANSSANSSPSFSSSPFSGTGKTSLSNSRIHGNMLVLTRPSPKPIVPQSPPSHTPPPPPPLLQSSFQDPIRSESDSISLRPLGSTGSGPSLLVSTTPLLASQKSDKDLNPPLSPSPSPKTNRFVPPHLRPGFAGREEKPGPDFQQKQPSGRTREIGSQRLGHYGEDGRLNSGLMEMKRPGSGGTRPSSSG